jgi:hypothetical protein
VATKSQDAQTQALIGGINFRVNVAKAFLAAWITAKVYFKAKVALTGAIHPGDVLEIGLDVYNIIVTTLDALRENMLPLEYSAIDHKGGRE